MSECKKNLSKDEIIMEFGKDDDLGKCAGCDNLMYKNGIITCKLIEKENNE